MNKAYSLVWNEAQGSWCAVGETARRRGKSGGGKRLLAAGVSLLGLAAASGAYALPTGGVIAEGQADIATSADNKTMSIHQHTDKLITNWQDFSVGGGERVSFKQPTNQSIALNRVIGANGSQIHGQLDANGRVFLVNPNGVMFGAGAQVNVGGLVASTQNLTDADFMAGRYRFAGTSGQSVENAGTIAATEGGSVALLGARVSNTGVIRAQMGRVALGAGNAFNVNFDGNGLLNLQVEGGAVDAQANNGGLLKADGGEVLMTARAAGDLLGSVVKNTGTIEAKGLSSRGGKITLDGGQVHVAGKLDASAQDASTTGGTVTTRGERVVVSRDVQVDTRAASGKAGLWTIEAANAGVGADAIDGQTLSRNLGTTNVALTNTSVDLTVGDAVSWTSDNALALTSKKGNVELKQALTASGANAGVTVNAAKQIRLGNKLTLTGENASLALNSGSGHTLTNDDAVVTLSGRNASFSANGEAYRVIHDLAGLRDVEGNMNGRYVLGNAVDGKGAQFRSLGGSSASFGGVFDGLGNTVRNLSVTNPGVAAVGLFAANTGRIANLTLEKITARAFGSADSAPVSVGVLAGYNMGEISNVKAKDILVSGRGRTIVGGLVGSNWSGQIDRASVSGRVEGDKDAMSVGGLVGENLTVLWPNRGDAIISNSRADVQVSSQSAGNTGGLVGLNRGVITASTAAGSVTAMARGARVGGLVGFHERGSIEASLSSASVLAGHDATAGGLVGYNTASIDASDATGSVTVGDNAKAGGLVGENLGKIAASTASGNVVAGKSAIVGGLVGVNRATILASMANGSVQAGNAAVAGGLVGYNAGTVSASTANGDVSTGADSELGGLVGRNGFLGKVLASNAYGNVDGHDNVKAGGLVGLNDGEIEGSSADGTVKVGARSVAGGLVGINTESVKSSDSRGSVVAGASSTVGGLVGENRGTVIASSAAGSVSAGANGNAGGLVGTNAGKVAGSSASGAVNIAGTGSAGGLVGRNEGSVSSSSASGDVVAGDDSYVGGLVGQNVMSASIDASDAFGSAKGGDGSKVGGLVGENDGRIASSSSSGAVSGGHNAWLGGVAGANFGTVERSSSSSRVAYTAGYDQLYGGLVGLNFGWMRGNGVSGSAAAVPLAGLNFGEIGN
ncbi:two-partner secretion domain-containing protein [Burkholderia cepacia]|uniref:two-partner secretion domain-containing protein n=1 Tax=Burkholderia cepacia TaxID=292 RepID=UPI001CF18187|nr:GLUG motif-containing protein [Burkholderia cepacia]MCA8053468.1 filamentous hemagglutinin N-terminal domain-containing protein [Burkholderia cepacia]MCA8132226.1 filamentous hemagglutinin N-terminal domain-containing protein [Burkholderia cepacia]